jgi:diguanylate cyclase (GGDEF)-like protein
MADSNPNRKQEKAEERYSHAGVQELAQLENDLLNAELALEAAPDSEEATWVHANANEALKLFFDEHDRAGAYKFDKFNRRLEESFRGGRENAPEISNGPDGGLELSERLRGRKFVFVNMGELGRINAEGGHDQTRGDKALGMTAGALESAVMEISKKRGSVLAYQIVRYDNSTFMLDLEDASEEETQAIEKHISEAELKVEGLEGKDPPPLTIRRLELQKHVVDVINQVQSGLERPEKLEAGEDSAKLLVSVLRRAADWEMETHKFAKRAQRVRDKIDGSADDLESYFENYAKKEFEGTPLSTLAAFREAIVSGHFETLVSQQAVVSVEKRFAAGRKADFEGAVVIDELARRRVVREGGTTEAKPNAGEPTDGEVEFENAAKAYEAAKTAAATAEGPEKPLLELKARNAEIKYRREVARRDPGTGLLRRGVYYEHMEEELKENRDTAVVFVDMGFLKYFDQMGGADVGDRALKTAARLMEQAVKQAGVKGQVYRYGGDEFTIKVDGGADAATAVTRALHDLLEASEPIPAGPKSRSEYAPTKLAINYSIADKAMLDSVHAIAVREGKYSKEDLEDEKELLNIKAETMTKAADVGIEYNKAYERFHILVKAMREPAFKSDQAREKQVKSLITFSNKAIFEKFGGAEHLQLLADGGLEGEALDEAILDYVVEMVPKVRAEQAGQVSLMDQLLALETRIGFLSGVVSSLEAKNSEKSETIVKLRGALERAETEKKQIIEQRGQIDQAA